MSASGVGVVEISRKLFVAEPRAFEALVRYLLPLIESPVGSSDIAYAEAFGRLRGTILAIMMCTLPQRRCDVCEEALAAWKIDLDIGDREGQATVVERVACSACKTKSSYMEPQEMTLLEQLQ